MAHGDITHTEIPVTDLEEARTFYADLFGWEINPAPGFETYPMWRAPNQISGGALTAREGDFTQPRSVVEVDSIDEALDMIEELGGHVVTGKQRISGTSWFAVFEDLDGNVLGLYEELIG